MKLSPTNSNDGTATSNLIKALTILQSLGEAIPVGGGVIKSIAGIGITILELAQSVRENQEECTRIAERAARDILSLHGELNGDLPISEDLRERLGSYLQVLEEVLKTVQELGEGSRTKRFLNADGVQSETKECVGILQDAYQRFILRSTIAADTKLTNILNAVTQLALTSERQSTSSSSLDDPDDPDEIPRIRISSLTFSSEIIRIEKKGFILRVQEGEMRDAIGKREAVMVRRFETAGSARAGQGQGGAGEDEGRKAFEREAEMRRDLLSREFGRMLGIAIASKRTRMIVLEAGTIVAYDYLQSMVGIEHFSERFRVLCELATSYRFLQDYDGSWNGGLSEIILNARDKRLCIGALGSIDGRSDDGGSRMLSASRKLTMGIDKEWRSSMSQEDFAHGFAQTKDLLQNWKTDKTSANARGVMDQMWLWSGEYPFSSSVHTNGVVSAGDIGWMDGEIWRAIPLEHGFEVAKAPKYNIMAHRFRDGEWEAIKGTQIAGYTRWTFEFRKGEEISLQTSLWSCWTDQIRDFFFRSGRLVAQRSAREVHELRAVTRSGVKNYATITVSGPEDDGTGEFGEHSEIYYFVHPVNADGSVVDPPGFWSFSSDPNPNDVLGSSMIKTSSRSEPDAEYTKISKPFLALIEDLVSHGFLAVPVENDASNCKEASRASVPDPAAAPRERRARRIFARARLSFGKPLTS